MEQILWTGNERFSGKLESRFIVAEYAEDLLKELRGLEDAVVLARSGEKGAVVAGSWWARRGRFESKQEWFTDAFDRTSYKTEVWYYRGEAKEDSAVELHPLRPETDIHKIPQAVELRTVRDLRAFLMEAKQSERLMKTDQNFELGGSLTAKLYVWMYRDEEQDKACLML